MQQRLRVTGGLQLKDESAVRAVPAISSSAGAAEGVSLTPLGKKHEKKAEKQSIVSISCLSVVQRPVIPELNGIPTSDRNEGFDRVVEETIRRFQNRHDLRPDVSWEPRTPRQAQCLN